MGCDHLRPEKYGMVFCPDCHGNGRDEDGEGPCQKCAGFGWLIGSENRCPTIRREPCGNKKGKNLLL
jgi:hypothetical protein